MADDICVHGSQFDSCDICSPDPYWGGDSEWDEEDEVEYYGDDEDYFGIEENE